MKTTLNIPPHNQNVPHGHPQPHKKNSMNSSATPLLPHQPQKYVHPGTMKPQQPEISQERSAIASFFFGAIEPGVNEPLLYSIHAIFLLLLVTLTALIIYVGINSTTGWQDIKLLLPLLVIVGLMYPMVMWFINETKDDNRKVR